MSLFETERLVARKLSHQDVPVLTAMLSDPEVMKFSVRGVCDEDVFLGLLGTFWGLLGTINSVGQVITGLDMGQQDFGKVFAELQQGLLAPLEGMGTAFSSSLLGLGGSLILGCPLSGSGSGVDRGVNLGTAPTTAKARQGIGRRNRGPPAAASADPVAN